MHDNKYDDQDEDQPISKTRRKQAMHAAQDIGEELVALNSKQLAQLTLPENLLDAVIEAKRLTKHEAIRRQMQYIGKIMRDVDATPIKAKLDEWHGVSQAQNIKLHMLERWRDRLLQDETALGELLGKHPLADAQHLRTLIRNAHKEHSLNKPPKSSRVLFKALREILLQETATTTVETGDTQNS